MKQRAADNSTAGITAPRRIVRRVMIPVLIVGVVAYSLSGLYVVQPDERGVVRCFGAFVERNVPPGIHWTFPRPIGRVETPRTTEVRRVTVGLKADVAEAIAGGDLVAISRSLETDMLTGDENILKLTTVVQYQIAGPAQYLSGVSDPDLLVRRTVLAVLVDILGGLPVDEALTVAKGPIQTQARLLAQSRLDAYGSGVALLSADLQAVDPPLAIIESFKDVASAKKDRERSRDKAITERNTILPKARGLADEMIQRAYAYAGETVKTAQGRADRFVALHQEYVKAPQITRDRLRLQTFERIFPRMKTYIMQDKPGDQATRIRLVE